MTAHDDATGTNGREAYLGRVFDIRDRHVLVTGAASGLGQAIAEAMVDAGAVVTLVDRDADPLRELADRLAGRSGTVEHALCDVADASAVRATVEAATARFGGLDVAFVNAGIAGAPRTDDESRRLERVQLDDWERVIGVNLTGALNTMRAAAAVMRPRRSGRIVVTASTAGLRADPMVGYPYVASKAAIVNVVRQAALDLAPDQIRVNAIAPGPFRTNIGGKRPRSAEAEATWARTIPLGRMADPEEIKGLALLLASPASSFMTGAVFPVDGGALALSHTI
ncbi:SDR family NAD(P)-dependent oxidoreductase [Plantactinospora endophytica]|uniref:Short-chain dehydrogenase n=1 Tax=Plantactinospora endophytica TaxID=673535 RepID=A0ABQ4EA11_9ACTN|nr:SDR family NAD(P)-dependent oxidoreductase [Plantactinospora endophytica]GIG91528.1 short-chain dehydrogenase [Plantactinospora endophytica]